MKIGILTFHRAHNYGALLQCFALKKYIESLGHDVDIVDYWPDYHSATYDLLPDFSSKSFKGKIKSLILFLLGFRRIIRRVNGYKRFMSDYLDLEAKVKYKSATALNELEFDVVVYGSDQIWWKSTLPGFKGYDQVYWGEQPLKTKRKITYAPSMGLINYDTEELNLVKKMLSNFDSISVRENVVKELFEKSLGYKASLVLDPVFLLDKSLWEKFCDSTSAPINLNEKYIFFYQLISNDDACRLVEKVAEYYGFRIIEISGRVDSMKVGQRYQQTMDPVGFVQLIRHAHFVVTTSFHGTAFSLIFEKQFFATGMGKNSERAKSLLNNLYVEKRYVDNVNNPNFTETINYKQVNSKIEQLKSESRNFLINNI